METMWPSLLLLQSVVMEREGELLERVGRLFGISSPNPALISASILHKELMESSGWGKTKGQPSDRPTGDGHSALLRCIRRQQHAGSSPRHLFVAGE